MSIPTIRFDVAPSPRMLWKQTRAQVLNSIRVPAFSLTTTILPIMFFAFFGLPYVNQTIPHSTVNVGAYLMG